LIAFERTTTGSRKAFALSGESKAGNTPMISTLASYKLVAENIDTQIQRVAEQPMVGREAEYYLENIGNVKSVDDSLTIRACSASR
jgi:hypothetical protein